MSDLYSLVEPIPSPENQKLPISPRVGKRQDGKAGARMKGDIVRSLGGNQEIAE
jgi:hypothetical protein